MSQSYFNAYRFVAYLVSPYATREKVLSQLTRRNSLDWEQVANVAGSHSVIQAIYPVLIKHELLDLVPDDFLSYIQHLHEINCERNEMLRKQAINAVRIMNKLNIKPLLMKGAAQLFLDTFQNLGDRLLVDIDILVPSNEIKRVSDELIATGYEMDEEKIHFIESHHHYPPLIKHGECAMVELHHDLMFREQQYVFPTEYAWSKAVDVALSSGVYAKVLEPTYRVFHGFLHRCVVDKLDRKGQVEIRQLHELACEQYRNSSKLNWDEMLEYARGHNVHKELCANLYTAIKFMEIYDLEIVLNKQSIRSIFQYIRICKKLEYDWFDTLDKKIARRLDLYKARHAN